MATTQPARVCVFAPRECPGGIAERTKPQDGAATPPRGRGLRPRRDRLSTTTNYILLLDSSSNGRESKDKIRLDEGGS